jgi:long-subunit fatty acid transport protein
MTLLNTRTRSRGPRLISALLALAALLLPAGAQAGGYDTPMLYSARHMGMGGAAVGYVGDASALFHNPAGLAQIGRYHLILDVSLLVGDLQASPVVGAENIGSERTVAPAFLVGAAFRVHERVTLGVGVFPVAAAGGEYRYTQPGGSATVVDRTSLNFFEFTPAIAVNIDEIGLRIGASYRITYVQLERARIPNPDADPQRPNLEINASGMDFLGFRLGVQYQPPQHPNLQLGLNYRHKTTTEVESSGTVYALGLNLGDAGATSNFILPSRLEFGARYDFGTANSEGNYAGGVAFDFIYAFNSQNDASGFRIGGIELVQVFDWTNGITTRLGGEYRVLDRRMPLRLGYSYDGKTSNPRFPTAFGTPGAPTHIMTVGGGYDAGPWELNIAYARRMGSATVTQANIDAGDAERIAQGLETCDLCGAPGDYEITLNGLYLDFSYDWD